MRQLLISSVAVAIVCCGVTGAAERHSPLPSTHDWPTFNRDVSRTGVSPDPTGITAANAGSLQRQQVQIAGTVDASAIYLHGVTIGGKSHNTFFVTTTYGKTIAIDADDGATLWTYAPQGIASWDRSRRVTTSTPVADENRQFIYAASPDGHVQKLAVADGHAVWSTAITLLPEREKIASPLSFYKGRIVATTGGYIGDAAPYQGHVAILNAASGKLEHVWNSLCSDRAGLIDPKSCPESGSAIWGRAGAVIDPSNGNIFVATGNGKWDGKTNWGDAVIQLDPDASRILGNYTPTNTEELDQRDADIGSTSPALLGGGLIAQGGKDNLIRLLSIQAIAGSAPHRGGELHSTPTPSGRDLFTAPSVLLEKGETWLFAADNGGTAAWVVHDGKLERRWKNDTAGTSPVIAGGLLFVYNPRGELSIYEAQSGRAVATLDCGTGHWNSPIVIDGRVALPEGNSNVVRSAASVLNIWRLPG